MEIIKLATFESQFVGAGWGAGRPEFFRLPSTESNLSCLRIHQRLENAALLLFVLFNFGSDFSGVGRGGS